MQMAKLCSGDILWPTTWAGLNPLKSGHQVEQVYIYLYIYIIYIIYVIYVIYVLLYQSSSKKVCVGDGVVKASGYF